MPDSTYASTRVLRPGDLSERLVVRNLGFMIRSDALIVGISVRVRRHGSAAGIRDHLVRLLRPGSGPIPATPTTWPTNPGAEVTYGGDLWGTTWTPAQITDPAFGFELAVLNSAASTEAQPFVDFVEIAVQYTFVGATVGPMMAGSSVSTYKNGGTEAWANPTAAIAEGAPWSSTTLSPGETSEWLYLSSFSAIGVPGTTVSGVLVEVKRRASANGSAALRDETIQLLPGGTSMGDNKARADPWTSADSWVAYGGPTDDWNVPWSSVPAPQGSLDLAIAVTSPTGAVTAEVDAARITVFYDFTTSTQTRSATATSEGSSRAWGNLAGARVALDSSLATTPPLGDDQSDHLVATDFGFSVPGDVTIQGVELKVARRSSATTGVLVDSRVGLVVGGALSGANRAQSTTAWTPSLTDITYGDPADLFGLGSTLTPAEVNSAGFGASLAVRNGPTPGFDGAQVDAIQLKVHYSCP
ncbi:MAG: hypothetical protein IT380_23030 [Myxococcales bacterium]|nr:hypothetical protein [Myxococcales bacterium]